MASTSPSTAPTPLDVAAPEPESRVAPELGAPLAIEVRDVEKTFRIPRQRIDSFKERAVHPFRRQEYRHLRALRDISFDVHRGEFFGIAGRNGSGKSTLLKILASIYKADAGTIRMAGRLAPFIELGVGFNHEFTARENVVLNGVMMGLSQREARRRLDAVLDFAELREYVDLKLKNYSSGMMVRLAFSIMLEARADIMLIDEVLAVGDASFQQKCSDVFREMHGKRTIVLVTHDMGAIESYCHRALLLHDGELVYVGDPEEVGKRYLRLNFRSHTPGTKPGQPTAVPDQHARLVDAWLENAEGERVTSLELGEPIRFRIEVEARKDLPEPFFGVHFRNADAVHVYEHNATLAGVPAGEPDFVRAGERVHISGTVENRLMPGRYFLTCFVVRGRFAGEAGLQALDALDFMVYGMTAHGGVVELPAEIEARVVDRQADG